MSHFDDMSKINVLFLTKTDKIILFLTKTDKIILFLNGYKVLQKNRLKLKTKWNESHENKLKTSMTFVIAFL